MISITRTQNMFVNAWAIVFNGKRVGSIVQTFDQYVVVRNKPINGYPGYILEVAARATTFSAAYGFVIDEAAKRGHTNDEFKADV